MISHALTIVANELQRHFVDVYNVPANPSVVVLGNLGEGFSANGGAGAARDKLVLSLVNLREEKALKNLPNAVRNDATLKVTYENPPFFLNLTTLLTATHTSYADALLVLCRGLRFLQARNTFTQDSVPASSISSGAPLNPIDRLNEFKLILDLQSPSLEEVNHMWGTLGGKQYPFALFNLRLVDLKFRAVSGEADVIRTIRRDFAHRSGGG